ncbi:hypothetical protein [Campylobacter rectus]|uniref:hypothetical protein n=1 Tax=Campylobacter rectus TaxID=203 RepID=UPI0028DC88E4|nr:hypothetical protein [Campylobacter rectus]
MFCMREDEILELFARIKSGRTSKTRRFCASNLSGVVCEIAALDEYEILLDLKGLAGRF